MEKKIYEGKVEKIVNGGFGLVRSSEGVVFLKYVCPGEKVEYIIKEKAKGVTWGDVVKISEPFEKRITPECSYYGECGGCILSHMPYEEQIWIKKEILANDLKRIGGLDIKIDNIYSSKPLRYRIRAKLKGVENSGKIGFIRRGTNDVMEINSCKIVDKPINIFIKRWNKLIDPPFFHQVDIFFNKDNSTTYAHLSGIPEKKDIELFKSFKNTVFTWKGKERESESVLKIKNYKFIVSPGIFFQVNKFQWEKMFDIVEGMLEHSDVSLDLYTGSGFFIPLLQKYSKKVIGVENNKLSINLARKSFPGVLFERSPVEKYDFPVTVDQILIDPPRSGLPEKVRDQIVKLKIKNIIYVSCSTSTLARDLKYFKNNGYNIKEHNMVDQFPQTAHIETITSLKLK
ncbi:MAG: hypothetical protein ABFR75_07170 [Acidobacteriota bacterium]